jgi:hypothetical protein
MADSIVTALIGLGGAIGGAVGAALIGVYAEELRALLPGQFTSNRDLKGNWDCDWEVTFPKEEHTIKDVVTIEKTTPERVSAIGHTHSQGSYHLRGQIFASNLVTFIYQGIEDRYRPFGGVVILELNAGRNRLIGYWYEYMQDRVIVGGKTVWTKSPK